MQTLYDAPSRNGAATALMPAAQTRKTAATKWQLYEPYRSAALQDGIAMAAITFPYLLDGTKGYLKTNKIGFRIYPSPRGAMSALCVGSLSSKIARLLFPQNTTNLQLRISPFLRITRPDGESELTPEENKQLALDLQQLAEAMLFDATKRALRQAVEETERHSMVTGIGLIHFPKGERARVFRMDQYVFEVDSHWNLLCLIVRQKVAWSALDRRVRDHCRALRPQELEEDLERMEVEVYTVLERYEDPDTHEDTGYFREYQECLDRIVDETITVYKTRRPPWVLVPWRRVAEGMWPVGLVRERAAIHFTHEGLSFSTQMIAAMAADRKRMVKRGSGTRIEDLTGTDPGAYVQGNPEDVGDTTLGDVSDVRWLTELNQGVISLMQRVYGMYNEEPVERRTGYEAGLLARETNATQQGVIALHEEILMRPMMEVLLDDAIDSLEPQKRAALRSIREAIIPFNTSGLDELAREDEASAWMKFLALVKQSTDSGFAMYSHKAIHYQDLARVAGVKISGVMLDDQQIQQIDQQARMANYMKGVPAALARGGGGGGGAQEVPAETAAA